MTRRTSRHGTTYTKGSSSTPPLDMPRTCHICGNRILTSKQAFQHHVNDITGHQYAWHIVCKRTAAKLCNLTGNQNMGGTDARDPH